MELSVIDLIAFGFFSAILANLVELPIIWWFSRPTRLLNRLKYPDEDVNDALHSLFVQFWNAANEPSLSTGKKDEDGKEIIITPIEALVQAAGESVVARIKGFYGSIQKAEGNLTNEIMGFAGPRKGQTMREFLIEQMLSRLSPVIEQKAQEFISKMGNNATQQTQYGLLGGLGKKGV